MRQSFHSRPGGNDDTLLRLVLLLLSLRGLEGNRVLSSQLRHALEPSDLVLLEQEFDALRVLLTHGTGTLHRDAVFELDVADANSELLSVLQPIRHGRRLEKRFGGDAPPEHAGPA